LLRLGGMTTYPRHPFTRADLERLGVTPRRLRTDIEAGRVRLVFRGVYVRADVTDSIELRAAAARLVLSDRAVVADRSAAWLHGVDCRQPTELDLPPRLEVVSRRGAVPSRRRDLLGGERDLADEDVMVLNGVAVTTPLRTTADLACRRGRASALAVLDAFAHHHGLTRPELERMAARFRRRRGVSQLRELIPLVEPLTESTGESWSRLAIHDAGLPRPEPQVWVRVEGKRYRLDLAWRWHRVAVEYFGREFHEGDELEAADVARIEALRRAGWIVIVVRSEDLSGSLRDAWLAEVQSALTERGPDARRRWARRGRGGVRPY
jgi:hypothetical protein